MREYFCAYHDMLGAMRKLSDAECGRLFRALLLYSSGEQPDNLQGREELLFDVFAQQIDRDEARYQKKCETNKANGSGRMRSLANGSVGTQEKEKEKEEPPKSPKVDDEGFKTFWAAYPRKTAKENARKAWKKLKVTEELLDTILAAVERHRKSDQWLRDGGQYIPHPATWLNGHRWEDEAEEPAEAYSPQINWADGW